MLTFRQPERISSQFSEMCFVSIWCWLDWSDKPQFYWKSVWNYAIALLQLSVVRCWHWWPSRSYSSISNILMTNLLLLCFNFSSHFVYFSSPPLLGLVFCLYLALLKVLLKCVCRNHMHLFCYSSLSWVSCPHSSLFPLTKVVLRCQSCVSLVLVLVVCVQPNYSQVQG